jgi:hypothetical protein
VKASLECSVSTAVVLGLDKIDHVDFGASLVLDSSRNAYSKLNVLLKPRASCQIASRMWSTIVYRANVGREITHPNRPKTYYQLLN